MDTVLNIEWENYEGETHGYNDAGDEVIDISARTRRNKWGESDSNIRSWTVMHDGNIAAKGRADGLRNAKREALAVLEGLE